MRRLTLSLLTLLAVWTSPLPWNVFGAEDPASGTIAALRAWLELPFDQRPSLEKQSFAGQALTRQEAQQGHELLWTDWKKHVEQTHADEWKQRKIQLGQLTMPFDVRLFGKKPAAGHSLVISLHGGGSSPKAVNDRQWENQKRLYRLEEGVYIAPRAPTDAWDMWHQGHMDGFLERLILDAVVFEGVNPDRVYVTGYSAGGDGIYRLAPRLADHWAAAAMMAGHPGDASALQLRNLPFAIHMGEKDEAFKRNQEAKKWQQRLEDLRKSDPDGYIHEVTLHPGKGHWMDRQDAVAMKWMAQYTRQPYPPRIVWQPQNGRRLDFYWLARLPGELKTPGEVIATRNGQTIALEVKGLREVLVNLHDAMMDLDQPITIESGGRPLFQGKVVRTIGKLHESLVNRQDPRLMFPAQVAVTLPAESPSR